MVCTSNKHTPKLGGRTFNLNDLSLTKIVVMLNKMTHGAGVKHDRSAPLRLRNADSLDLIWYLMLLTS